jgi:hypothetical protein
LLEIFAEDGSFHLLAAVIFTPHIESTFCFRDNGFGIAGKYDGGFPI